MILRAAGDRANIKYCVVSYLDFPQVSLESFSACFIVGNLFLPLRQLIYHIYTANSLEFICKMVIHLNFQISNRVWRVDASHTSIKTSYINNCYLVASLPVTVHLRNNRAKTFAKKVLILWCFILL